jgi:hypothetical protein
MTQRSPWVIYGAILLFVASVSTAVYYHTGWRVQSDSAETPQFPVAQSAADNIAPTPKGVRVEGGEVEQRDEEGTLLWRVRTSGELLYDDTSRQLRGSDVEFDVLAEGETTVSLNAPTLLADYDGKRVEFSSGVSGTAEDHNSSFEMQQMEYLAGADIQKLVGSGEVTLRRGDYLIRADQLVIDVKHRQMRLRGNVTVTRRR